MKNNLYFTFSKEGIVKVLQQGKLNVRKIFLKKKTGFIQILSAQQNG